MHHIRLLAVRRGCWLLSAASRAAAGRLWVGEPSAALSRQIFPWSRDSPRKRLSFLNNYFRPSQAPLWRSRTFLSTSRYPRWPLSPPAPSPYELPLLAFLKPACGACFALQLRPHRPGVTSIPQRSSPSETAIAQNKHTWLTVPCPPRFRRCTSSFATAPSGTPRRSRMRSSWPERCPRGWRVPTRGRRRRRRRMTTTTILRFWTCAPLTPPPLPPPQNPSLGRSLRRCCCCLLTKLRAKLHGLLHGSGRVARAQALRAALSSSLRPASAFWPCEKQFLVLTDPPLFGLSTHRRACL